MYDDSPLELIEFHNDMLADETRMTCFLRAILKSVRPGQVVLDIGTGTGILAYFACLAGASHVYALEQGPVVELAMAISRRNGYENRITFINDWSTQIELPEAVDVIVTETLGNVGFDEGILGWVIDARKRFLANGGLIIPATVELVAAPVESGDLYGDVGTWLDGFYSVDYTPVRPLVVNNLLWADIPSESLLSKPATLARAELAQVTSTDVSGESSFVVGRDGILHGLGAWFKAELTPDIKIDLAPPLQAPSWDHAFMPLERPLRVSAGDQLIVQIETSDNSAHWQWRVSVYGSDGEQGRQRQSIQFEQTTRLGDLPLPQRMRSPDYKPCRNLEGEADLLILRLMDGTMPVVEIAQRLRSSFPGRFPSMERALAHVYDLLQDYSPWAS